MSAAMVIFGASGDLTSRKLIPALYQLFRKGKLPQGARVFGLARTPHTDEEWRHSLAATTAKFCEGEFEPESWQAFAQCVHYCPGDITDFASFAQLKARIESLCPQASRVFYLATAPQFYRPAAEAMAQTGLVERGERRHRVVIEKPFGVDLPSAVALNKALHQVMDEEQIFRIDHYLGKETVQNLLVLRFANTIFEPIWNRNYVDHVQITVAEEVKVGRRGGYYETAGILRDMFQNHLLQLMMITAMETPVRYHADAIRNEKVKVLQAVRALQGEAIRKNAFAGQYLGYRQEEGVHPQSRIPTFAVVKFSIDNWRWQGVPFYLRSGKAMSCRTTQIVIQFRETPHWLFDGSTAMKSQANRLVIQIQPAEGIQLQFQTKVPDHGIKLRLTDLDFRFSDLRTRIPEAYERLLLDTLLGDASLFARADEVERSWELIDPILKDWEGPEGPQPFLYEPEAWGPSESTDWMEKEGREWFDTCPVLGPKPDSLFGDWAGMAGNA